MMSGAKNMRSDTKSLYLGSDSDAKDSLGSASGGIVGNQIRSSSKADDKRSDKVAYEGDLDGDNDECYYADEKGEGGLSDLPVIEVLEICIGDHALHAGATRGRSVPVSAPLDLRIRFTLDRDVVAAYWTVKLLVDSSFKRIIRELGSTAIEDYPDGESEMRFKVDAVDVSGIPPSVLSNFGLLMVALVVDGIEAASVNMVVNVSVDPASGQVVREIYNPLE